VGPGIQAPYQTADLSQQGIGSSGKQTQEADSFSQLGAAEKSMGSKDLPEVISQTASNSGISQQGASSSSKLMEGRNSKVVASEIGRLHLEKTKLSESAGRSLNWLEQAKGMETDSP
jgi:hypothetical protein